ncbi:MAG: nucleotidyl transferase AbiEii/AbiGii toxin family protein [Patescibacteria group bacterium]
MISIRPIDVRHKMILIRTLIAISDTSKLSQNLRFKGGTCAAMSGFLDRMSVDLDFDVVFDANIEDMRGLFHQVFKKIGMSVLDESKKALTFLVKYESNKGERNTMKIDALERGWKANIYEMRYLSEIDRAFFCQTKETMVSNKLVSPLDRYRIHKNIAGRDIYDIYYFLSHGYGFIPEIIRERTGKTMPDFFDTLIEFVKKRVNKQIIDEDLNTLLPYDTFRTIRGSLKEEVISLLEEEKKV